MVPIQTDLAAENATEQTSDSDVVMTCQSWPEEDCFLSHELVIEQLKKGIHPDQVRNRNGETMLTRVIDASSVQTLIAAGADVNAKDKDGWTAVMYAKDVAIVQVLIAAGADVNAKDKKGMTALMEATIKNKADSVRALIAAGADVNARNNEGKSALSYANYDNIIELLKDAGAKN